MPRCFRCSLPGAVAALKWMRLPEGKLCTTPYVAAACCATIGEARVPILLSRGNFFFKKISTVSLSMDVLLDAISDVAGLTSWS